jgi:predicted Zn finger-like uncharacterized protein
MKIACPHCGLVGNIGEEKLRASSGSVRCPRCHKAFAPGGEKPSSGADGPPKGRGAPPGKKTAKKDPVLFGARSGDDIPFTKIMEESELISDQDLTIEIEGVDLADIPEEIGADEVISLGEEDIVPAPGAGRGRGKGKVGGEAADIPVDDIVGSMTGDIPDSPIPAVLDEAPVVEPAKPHGGLSGLFGAGRKESVDVRPPLSVRPAPRVAGLRKGFVLFLIIVLALWGGYWFFSTYWPPYAQEKGFLSDSRALFDKYHELRVYLKVGMPDPVFATKVAEAAYYWEVYREKHEAKYQKDPLFASLMVMGRLFLTIKELLDRDMYPDNYLGLEWGEGFPFPMKEDYVNAMVAGIPICISAAEENFVFSKKILDHTGGLTFISMTAADILNTPVGPSRADYAADLKRANKVFIGLDTQMPVLAKAVADVRNILNKLPGK